MSDPISLERLRKQAKTILKQCRAGDMSAIKRVCAQLPRYAALDRYQLAAQIKLADIQHALAREHGYRNWAELKRHDAPLERFLAAVRGGALRGAQRELESFPNLADESIHAACALGDSDAVRYHLDLDPEQLNALQDGWPPLVYACASPFHHLSPRHAAGILDGARVLLDRGADPNTCTLADPSEPDSRIPLLSRVHLNNNLAMRSLLLERGAAELDFKSIPKATRDAIQGLVRRTQLDMALSRLFKVDPEFLEAIRERMAHLKPGFEEAAAGNPPGPPEKGAPRQPPFFLTNLGLRKYVIEMVELALARGISPNLPDDPEGNTILHQVVRLGSTPLAAELAEWLVAHGADPNIPRDDGLTPFLLAVRCGNKSVADTIRAHGGNIDAVQPVDEFIGACRRRDTDEAKALIRSHPGLFDAMRSRDFEILVSAAEENRLEDVRFMVRIGFDLDGFGENGATALHAAAWHGHVAMVQLLVESCAPVNIRDTMYGTSPLAWAAYGSKNCADSPGSADDRYCAIVEMLLNAGADHANAVNRWGVDPEKISTERVAAYLRSRGF